MGDAQVAPTRMAQQVYKGKKVAANKGYDLLKKKADALKVRFRDIAKEIHAAKGGMSESCAGAFFSLTAAQYAAGDFKHSVLEGNFTARLRVHGHTDNVAGVKIPVFKPYDAGDSAAGAGAGAGAGGAAGGGGGGGGALDKLGLEKGGRKARRDRSPRREPVTTLPYATTAHL